MKTAIVSFGLLVGILAYCAWLNSNDLQRQIERQPKIGPHVTYKVKPPVADDELNVVNNPQLMAAIREADKAIPLNVATL